MPTSLLLRLGALLGAFFHSPAPGLVGDAKLPLLRLEAFDYALRGPLTARAGFTRVRIVNRGQSPHHLEFTKVPDTASVATVQKLFSTQVVNATVKDWGGPNITMPGDSSEAIVQLQAGRYTIECWITAADGKPHVMKGMITMINVSKTSSGSVEPHADLVLNAKDYTLAFHTEPTRGHHLVRFENTGPQEHDVEIIRLRAGETVEAIRKWALAGLVGGPPVGQLVGGAVGIDRGNRVWFPIDLRPGRYAMFCFVPDSKDEKPHLLHGMIQEFTVR
jgi:hypothetical protein